jgi:hypothetical protein
MQAARAPQLPQTPLPLAPVGAQAVALACDGGRLSADAGLVLRTDLAAPLGFTRHLAAVRAASRAPRRVTVTRHERRTPRVWPMAAGSEEANASHTRRDAPICTLRRHRLPATGAPLASPPTLSRWANRVSRRARSRRARGGREPWSASSPPPPTVLGLEVADTADRVHGPQEHARDESYAGGDGCRPLHRYAGRSGRLRTPRRKAQRCPGPQRLAVWQRLGKRRRPAWPEPLVRVRGDRHWASPAGRPWSDAPPARRAGTGWTSTAGFQAWARAVGAPAQRASAHRGPKVPRFPATRDQAGTWARARRVVSTGAGADPGVTPRLVVTALAQARPTVLDQHSSGARGHAANERTAHPLSVPSARPSCHRGAAHPWRVFWHAAAARCLET